MDDVTIHTLFYGSGWTQTRKDAHNRYLEASLAWLGGVNAPSGQRPATKQYGLGRVRLATSQSGYEFGTSVAPKMVSDSELKGIITSAQTTNGPLFAPYLPPYGPRTLILVFLAVGFQSDAGGQSYHRNDGLDRIYAVVVDSGGSCPVTTPTTPFNPSLECGVGVINHELIEAALNPNIFISGKRGWYGTDEGDEAADNCPGGPDNGSWFRYNGTDIVLGGFADNTQGGACTLTAYTATPSVSKITRPAVSCRQLSASAFASINTDPTNNAFGQWGSTSTGTLVCPVNGYSTKDITSVTVDGWKGSSSGLKAKACVAFSGGWGGNCDAQDSNASTGVQHVTINPSSTVWANGANDYRFVLVTMTGSGNSVFGYRQN
jgi:hypothetical protein